MADITKRRLLDLLDSLIAEARAVAATRFEPHPPSIAAYVDLQSFARWRAGCVGLMRILGRHAAPWQDVFTEAENTLGRATEMLGTLEGIKAAVENDLLVTVEELVFAEAFADLLEQAEYLSDSAYFLAAGVLARAVLEEHLRKLCDGAACPPTTPKPTIHHYREELQKAGHLNKIEVAEVEAMAAKGNAAAHNTGALTAPDAAALIRGVREFLSTHPL
jgi:hypothetical protein